MSAAVAAASVSIQDGDIQLFTWNLTTAVPDGLPIQFPEFSDRTWQATGTFGGAVCAFQGSNDGTNWFPLLNSASGSAATLSAQGGLATIELPLWVRPNLTTVGAGAVIAATLCARRQPRSRS